MSQARGDLLGLKALVAGLGVLIVLGTATVIGVVIKRIYAGSGAPSMSVAAVAPGLPPGSHISGLAGAGDAFAVWVSGPRGDAVYLLNPQTGALSLAVQAGK